jgi:hypothetical protein
LPAGASAEASPAPAPEDLDIADFARLATLGMERKLVETVLTKLDESMDELPV